MVAVAGFEFGEQVSDRPTGAVWRATDLANRRAVGLKQVVATSAFASDRLRTVGAVLAGAPHPNIVQLYDFVPSPEGLWLVGEWVDCVRLDELGAEPITAQQAVALVTEILQGLAHAHERGIVHGDVSPATIVLTATGTPRLIDFGLAGPMGVTGLPAASKFTSPESAGGQVPSAASDVFSAAGVLARLLAKSSQPDASGPAIDAIPVPLRPVLNKALSTEPVDRYPGAREFLVELSHAADESFGFGWPLTTTMLKPALPETVVRTGRRISRQRRSADRALTNH